MGQRPSMQQQSEVARRPRAGSDELGNAASTRAVHQHHRRPNGARFGSRHQQHDTSSASSASSFASNGSISSADGADDGSGGAELARQLLTNLGLSSTGASATSASSSPGLRGTMRRQQQNGGGITPSSAPSTSVQHPHRFRRAQHHHATSSGSSSHHRFGGSQRLGRRLEGSERLQALLQSLDAMAATSNSSSTTPSSAQLNKLRHSVPLLQLLGRDIKCPVCRKIVPSDDVEMHLVICFTRPQLSYNDDILTSNKGECAICFEDMDTGDKIARLPCLCIYHKGCIDEWFKRKNTCPEHPGED